MDVNKILMVYENLAAIQSNIDTLQNLVYDTYYILGQDSEDVCEGVFEGIPFSTMGTEWKVTFSFGGESCFALFPTQGEAEEYQEVNSSVIRSYLGKSVFDEVVWEISEQIKSGKEQYVLMENV